MPSTVSRRAFLLFLAFLSGGAIMTVEMTGARALSPHFGSSTIVWTNVIGSLMAALALGYYVGGRVADRNPRLPVLLGLLGTAGCATALLPMVIHPLARACVPAGIAAEHSYRINLLGSLALTLGLFVPVAFLLATAPPFLVRLLTRDREEAGRAAGRVNAYSAVGSLVGTFLPALILIPALGTRLAFTAVAAALVLPVAAGFVRVGQGRRRFLGGLFLLPLVPSVLVGGRSPHPGPETLDERDSVVQYVRVYEREGRRYLTLNEGRDQFHSLLVEGKVLTEGNYYDYLNLLPLHFDPALRPRLRVCVVGLAAGIYGRQIQSFFDGPFRVEVDGAEIDPEVLDVARLHFGLQGPENRNLKAAAADGRLFLETSRGLYDLIAVDAYSRQLYIPFHLVTEEFFALCRDRLTPGGFLAVNVCDFGARSPALDAIRRTLQRVFGNTGLLRLPGTLNYLLWARNAGDPGGPGQVEANLSRPFLVAHPEGGALTRLLERALPFRVEETGRPEGEVLTDDRAPIESLMDASFRRVRRTVRYEEEDP